MWLAFFVPELAKYVVEKLAKVLVKSPERRISGFIKKGLNKCKN